MDLREIASARLGQDDEEFVAAGDGVKGEKNEEDEGNGEPDLVPQERRNDAVPHTLVHLGRLTSP